MNVMQPLLFDLGQFGTMLAVSKITSNVTEVYRHSIAFSHILKGPVFPSNKNWTFKYIAKCNGVSIHFCYIRCDLRDCKHGSKLPKVEEKRLQSPAT